MNFFTIKSVGRLRPTINLLILVVLASASTALYSQQLTHLATENFAGSFKCDITTYVDSAGTEYAIVGDNSGPGHVAIFDLTDPTNPDLLATVDGVPGFDVRVWQNYVYCVNGGSYGETAIIDIADPANPQVVGQFTGAHNIWITETGQLILEGGAVGMQVYDLNADPLQPQFMWDTFGGGHDAAVVDHLLLDFHGTEGAFVYDFSNPASEQLMISISDPTITYAHSGWVTADHQYLYICDELAEHPQADISIWDISDPGNPERINDYSDPDATVHNFYIVGNYAFVSYYTAGLRVFDISDPTELVIADEYDTNSATGEGFAGAFGVNPFLPSGLIVLSDWDNGLFVFDFDEATTDIKAEDPVEQFPTSFVLEQNFPNPFNPYTTIRYRLAETSTVSLIVYDIAGSHVKTLVNGQQQSAAGYEVTWNGTNEAGTAVVSGQYFYRLATSDGHVETRKMTLIQ